LRATIRYIGRLLTRRMTATVLLLKGRGGDWRAARLLTLATPD